MHHPDKKQRLKTSFKHAETHSSGSYASHVFCKDFGTEKTNPKSFVICIGISYHDHWRDIQYSA